MMPAGPAECAGPPARGAAPDTPCDNPAYQNDQSSDNIKMPSSAINTTKRS